MSQFLCFVPPSQRQKQLQRFADIVYLKSLADIPLPLAMTTAVSESSHKPQLPIEICERIIGYLQFNGYDPLTSQSELGDLAACC